MKGNLYTVFYAAMLGLVCALLLTVVSELTKEAREANIRAEKYRNIFTALKIPFDAKATGEDLEVIYSDNITEKPFGQNTKMFIYTSSDVKDKMLAAAVRVAGPGLWGPIEGFLALEPDMKTIRGLTFYKQEETPGLGGEIATAGFRDQFIGKSIYDAEGDAGIVIVTGKPADGINQVDGISGATMTCDKVQELLNNSIVEIAEAK